MSFRSSGTCCAVRGCTNNQTKLNMWLQERCLDHAPQTKRQCSWTEHRDSFHHLPTEEEPRRMWLKNLNLKRPPRTLYVCSFHFEDRKPTEAHPHPTLWLGYEKPPEKRRRVLKRDRSSDTGATGQKSDDPLHPDYVPSLFSFTSTSDKTRAVSKLERYLRFQHVSNKRADNKNGEQADSLGELWQRPVSEQELLASEAEIKTETGVQGTEVQTEETHNDIASLYEQIKSLIIERQSLRDEIHKLQSELKRQTLDVSQFDNSKIKCFTGLPNLQTFMLVLSYVSSVFPATANQSLKPIQELLLTLMKLRLNLSEEFLGYLFGIHQSAVSRVFHHWIDVMASRLHPLILWPEREDLRRSLPMCFRTFFNNCVSIIDCFELFIERPSDLTAQAQTWSSYKQHNTIKFLISVTPQGRISFVSKAWGGRVTDKYLTEHSGFLDKLLPGDLVLADRGFMTDDSVGLFCAELVTPPFTGGKKQLSRKEIESTQAISRVRIHVDRVIGMLRQKYTIMGSTLPVSVIRVVQNGQVEDSLIDKIVLTCCALCNLCECIVPSDCGEH